jgi:hypothetical protein
MRDLPDYWERCYFCKDELSEYIIPTKFYQHSLIEEVYEDTDTLIDTEYSEYCDEDGNMYDEKIVE